MAIAALSVESGGRERRAIMRTAVGFAVGHAVVLGIGAVLALGLGFALPAAFETGAERLGGLLLIALGGLGLWGVATGRTFGHAHTEADGKMRWHLHLGAGVHHPHGHSRMPTLLGAVFALSSLRALMLLEPFGASASALAVPVVLALVVLFGAGILMSMSLFGVVLARALSFSAVHALSRFATLVVAAASILLGLYWLVS